jgi:hypothetical protein
MYRRRIQATCNNPVHLFPVRMRYGGSRFWQGMRVHVMYCPACGCQRHYVYHGWRYKRVA